MFDGPVRLHSGQAPATRTAQVLKGELLEMNGDSVKDLFAGVRCEFVIEYSRASCRSPTISANGFPPWNPPATA